MAGAAGQTRGLRRQHQTLPFDVLMDIAARTDPATLVRFAATCMDMRRRVKDDTGLRRRFCFRLRHGDRIVLPFLRGHLIQWYDRWHKGKEELLLLNTTGIFGVLASCDGLVLSRVARELRVCNPATGSSQALPSQPHFPVPASLINYVLLVCDDDETATAVGRHFQVVTAYLDRFQHFLQLQTFSSEHGVWGQYGKIQVLTLRGSLREGLGKALVVDGDVYWLCLTTIGAYVLKLHIRAAQVTVTMLPNSFPHRSSHGLLAMLSAGRSPIVLIVKAGKISAWAKSMQTAKWQQQVVIETEEILRFLDKAGGSRPMSWQWLSHPEPKLLCFAERSGTVLINMPYYGFFWLDLQAMEIVRWFPDIRAPYMTENISHEINLEDWVPTFSTTL